MSEDAKKPSRQLTVSRPSAVAAAAAAGVVPAIIAAAGEHAARRFLEFFAATIRNKNTRMAYYHACRAVLRLVRPAQDRRARRHRAAARRRLYRGARQGFREADGQAAPGRHPHAVRLAGHRPGRRHQSGPRGARAEARRQDRQDHGARPANRRASCWTASTRQPWSACAIGR